MGTYDYLTPELLRRFAEVGDQREIEQNSDIIIVAKYFTSDGSWVGYAASYDPESETFFGFVQGIYPGPCSFSLETLRNIRGIFGSRVKRDLYFSQCRFSELVNYKKL